ncbi:DivIVA domain-containing protein [Modestobacter versicolor]|uniref:Cell wall synthesis protein Wag31 n=1 Tax=Modestobacter versicolor TaxID=429133 RepID=A0A323V2Z0_9ACTN|nr:DivIVA domain-containing protein [Modestobacter versicolor]MBB3675093.1 DivIVA domain-containing protein [Modestobacter versicolor]PZA19189.1 cell division protein DivIVA [Modestobacter versicolor]
MTTSDTGRGYEAGPPTADDLRRVSFTQASMLHPGYTDREVDQFVARVADELARLTDENAQLRQHLQALQEQLAEAAARPSPSDQAVGILATAQLTADEYVAEAEDFSRQMTSEARAQYEEQLTRARERAGAIIQAATEARTAIAAAGGGPGGAGPDTQELQEQVAYLKAFGQATRVQLRAYLEALLRDVETEWGRAHPAVLPPALLDHQPDPGGSTAMSFRDNAADDATGDGDRAAVPATRSPS